MSIPILFSSGCAQAEGSSELVSSTHITHIDEDAIKDKLYDVFACYFASNKGECSSLDTLLTDEEITDVINCSKTTRKCDFEWDGDIQNLKEVIKNNSIQFLNEHHEYKSAFCDFSSADDLFFVQKQFEEALNVVIDHLITNASNNINEDICKFQTLNIVLSDEVSSCLGEYLKDSNTIILYYRNLRTDNQENSEFFDLLKHTLSHEINGSMLVKIECRQVNNMRALNIYKMLQVFS